MFNTQVRQKFTAMIKRGLLAGVFAVSTATMVAAPEPALAASFLRLGNIRGESTDSRHKDEIDILSFTQSFINNSVVALGGGGGSAGKVQCGAITVIKNIDRASPLLLRAVATGEHIRDGRLTFRNEDSENLADYYTIDLRDVLVSELTQTDNPDPNRIVEKLVLNASVYIFSYKPQNKDGSLGAEVRFGFDCLRNRIL